MPLFRTKYPGNSWIRSTRRPKFLKVRKTPKKRDTWPQRQVSPQPA